MKTNYSLTLAALGLAACLPPAYAQLVIPSDGSDGAFNPGLSPTNVVIDLSQAVTGNWNANNSANAGKGIYDASKWAVVFKYSSVNIPAGVAVRFKNHPTHAPVVWLVRENATNAGRIYLSGDLGQAGSAALTPPEPGPGGFRGGVSGPAGTGVGLGIGNGGNGAYASVYGNPSILPLIGGSGGNGSGSWSGGAGGGAILIAVSGVLDNAGSIFSATAQGSGGSGGAVRIIASQVTGSGEINCLLDGRVRIEANTLATSLRTSPETIRVSPATPPLIWAPEAAPTVSIVAVSTNATPADPTAPLVSNADVAIEINAATTITLETRNFPIEGVVEVRATQKWGGASWIRAWYVSGDQATAQWRATNTFVKGYTTLQARATAP
jgi:hypothetical protein